MISLVSTGEEAPSALDAHVLTFGNSGYALYTAMRIPVSLKWTFLIPESDEDVVELGRRIDTFASSALTLLATAATPQLTAAAITAKFVARAIRQVLVRNRDDVPDLSKHVRSDDSISGTTYTV